MPEPQAKPAPAHVSAGEAEASMTCPVCKGEGFLEGRPIDDNGDVIEIPYAYAMIRCNECGGIGQVPAKPPARTDSGHCSCCGSRYRCSCGHAAEPDVNAELADRIKFLEELRSGQAVDIAQLTLEVRRLREQVDLAAIQRAEAQR